jgi:hypothetical protein
LESTNFLNVFIARSEISQLSGRLRPLPEFLFVGMAIASPMRVLFKPLTTATSPAAYPEGHRRTM